MMLLNIIESSLCKCYMLLSIIESRSNVYVKKKRFFPHVRLVRYPHGTIVCHGVLHDVAEYLCKCYMMVLNIDCRINIYANAT
jgi:hypothetical protein